ncbi:hypothetical protein H920_02177 [Fukomys damarensis]|uniref:Uncharacterized protein n=1 Tax=Fukomys damarensis TaxID=885580 RepID=A0A091E141_FUKDA|nr:hypothetical protein H920_02177 [Fukomys damarensis]
MEHTRNCHDDTTTVDISYDEVSKHFTDAYLTKQLQKPSHLEGGGSPEVSIAVRLILRETTLMAGVMEPPQSQKAAAKGFRFTVEQMQEEPDLDGSTACVVPQAKQCSEEGHSR